jgi:protein required for attachment to host cells
LSVVCQLNGRSLNGCGSAAPLETVELAIRQLAKRWLAEQEFAKEIAKALDHAHFKVLILVAPARMLADLRTALSEKTRRAIVAEIDKDLTKHPVYEIERHLTGG